MQEPQCRKRAVIYCRVSTDKQEQDGESLDYQYRQSPFPRRLL